jgi:hydrogenase maturation protein HypF
MGVCGWVNNTRDGVHIRFQATETKAAAFYQACMEQAPDQARITGHRLERVTSAETFASFEIVHSEEQGEVNMLVSPDFGMCSTCRKEILDPNNRRFGYAFTTCTHCGPRFSILNHLPYDRPQTTMAPFELCPPCLAEYDNPLDRRYFSQTNSCPDCGIRLIYHRQQEPLLHDADARKQLVSDWKEGKIVAIKGIGGFLLTCDASSPEAVRRIRSVKQRADKPFALMYPDRERIEEDLEVRPEQLALLASEKAPIGLFPLRRNPKQALAWKEIAPGLGQLGVMLPYTPLYELLLKEFGRPIVATSGNVSGYPIVYRSEKLFEQLGDRVYGMLDNDRDIVIPQDDSVLRFTASGRPLFLRRSRGYAPTLHIPGFAWSSETQLAFGAMLKSTLALLHRQNTYVSPYLGNLDQFDTQCHFQTMREHLCSLLDAHPDRILVDLHPDYPSTRMGQEMAAERGLPVHSIQHHEAHFAAILGEHQLLNEEVLGIVWDGTGLGKDGQIWGGEAFTYRGSEMERVAHLPYFPLLLGDKMIREPRLSALSLSVFSDVGTERLRDKFSEREWDLYRRMLARETRLSCSSMGRLFDGVASWLGVCDRMSYEGQAAMLLEEAATAFLRAHPAYWAPFDLPWEGKMAFPLRKLFQALEEALAAGENCGELALRFQQTLAEWPGRIAEAMDIRKVAFSGGVFQNTLLVDVLENRWKDQLKLYFHEQLSPNDESVSFGQLVHYHIQMKNRVKKEGRMEREPSSNEKSSMEQHEISD